MGPNEARGSDKLNDPLFAFWSSHDNSGGERRKKEEKTSSSITEDAANKRGEGATKIRIKR